MARRKVAVYNADDTSAPFITFKEAIGKVEAKQAEWCGLEHGFFSLYKAIRIIHRQVAPKGKPQFQWRAKFSGNRGSGDRVSTQKFRTSVGVMVMQMESGN